MTVETEAPTKTNEAVKTRIKSHIKEPPLYRVVFVNDDKTTMEFVVESLVEFFSYTEERAVEKTTEIHEQGSSVVATYSYELAEQKGIEVTLAARSQGYPLQVRIEPEQ
jgi:ATP-dependent Clp protease adaptor protein ClpS